MNKLIGLIVMVSWSTVFSQKGMDDILQSCRESKTCFEEAIKGSHEFVQQKDTLSAFSILNKTLYYFDSLQFEEATSYLTTLANHKSQWVYKVNHFRLTYTSTVLENFANTIQEATRWRSQVKGQQELLPLKYICYGYERQFDFISALEFSKEHLRISSFEKDTVSMVFSYQQLGRYYGFAQDSKNSMESYQKSLDLDPTGEKYGLVAMAYFGLAAQSLENHEFNEALEFGKKIWTCNPKAGHFQQIHALFAEIFLELGQLDSCQVHVTKTFQLAKDSTNSFLDRSYWVEARNHYFNGAVDRSNYLSQKGIDLAKQNKNYDLLHSLYAQLKTNKIKEGKLLQALSYSDSSLLYLEKSQDQINQNKTYRATVTNDLQLRDKQEALIKNNLALEKYNKRLSWLLSSVLATALMLLLVVFRNRSKRISLEKELAISENNLLNDRLKNYTTVIQSKNKTIEQLKKTSLLENGNQDPLRIGQDWVEFTSKFKSSYGISFDQLEKTYPDLSGTDRKIMMLIKLRLSNKEIAQSLSITENGVKKAVQRVRKKLAIPSTEKSHQAFDKVFEKHRA